MFALVAKSFKKASIVVKGVIPHDEHTKKGVFTMTILRETISCLVLIATKGEPGIKRNTEMRERKGMNREKMEGQDMTIINQGDIKDIEGIDRRGIVDTGITEADTIIIPEEPIEVAVAHPEIHLEREQERIAPMDTEALMPEDTRTKDSIIIMKESTSKLMTMTVTMIEESTKVVLIGIDRKKMCME
jgi:hypothetical protein